MSDSNSSSTSAQTTNYSDSRKVLGQGAMDVGGGSSVSINTTTADPAIVGKALDSNLSVTKSALNFGSDALGFGGRALDTVDKTVSSSLNFAGDTVNGAYVFGDKVFTKAIDSNANALDQALSFASGSQNKAFNIASDAMNTAQADLGAALTYGKQATAATLDSVNSAAQMVNTAYADAKGRGALTDKIMMAAIVGALFVAYQATRK